MSHGRPFAFVIFSCLVTLATGCGDSPEMIEPEIDIAIPDSSSDSAAADGTPQIEAPRRSEGDLNFSLKPGARIPLQKHIRQTLVQDLADGPVTSQSDLKLMFAITVNAEDQGRRRLGVRYQRVQYSHEFSGETVAYDSMSPPAAVPDSLQMYHGLANNGFDFWIGANNRIIEVLGFQDFLRRCVRYAPANRQGDLLNRIQGQNEDEGFANFVDDSIGLLPYNPDARGRETMVKINDSWHIDRDLREPLPMRIRTTYTLTDLTDTQAHIAVLGTIQPLAATQLGPLQQAAFGERLTLESGRVLGTIVIDVTTGLPFQSHVERRLRMNVYVPGQAPFQQTKTVATSINSFRTDGEIVTPLPAAGPGQSSR